MKKYFVLIAMLAIMCSLNVAASNFDTPPACHFKDSNGKIHNGRMATVSGTWQNNNSNSSSTSISSETSGNMGIKGIAEVQGNINSTSSNGSSSGSSSSQTITREACCDANSNCETVNYQSGWKTRTTVPRK